MDGWLAHVEKRWQPYLSSRRPAVRSATRVVDQLWRCARATLRLGYAPEFRAVVFLRLFHGDRLHQTTVLTRMNRYPQLFAATRQYFAGRTDLRVLSYGCATGEEVLTLRGYLPSATIVGAEINPQSLAHCRSLKVDDRIVFLDSNHDMIASRGPFDAVFCLAVLQRGPHEVQRRGISNLTRIYPFEKFEREVTWLDSLVAKDGLLVIHFAQYDFSDTGVAAKYEPLGAGPPDGFPRFDRQGDLKPQPLTTTSMFVKRQA
jgi:hypothetical protein